MRIESCTILNNIKRDFSRVSGIFVLDFLHGSGKSLQRKRVRVSNVRKFPVARQKIFSVLFRFRSRIDEGGRVKSKTTKTFGSRKPDSRHLEICSSSDFSDINIYSFLTTPFLRERRLRPTDFKPSHTRQRVYGSTAGFTLLDTVYDE